jgi:hypothetical protein
MAARAWQSPTMSDRLNPFRAAVCCCLFLAGCASTPDEMITPLTEAQRAQLLKSQRAPELFGLTAYESEGGPIYVGGQRTHPGDLARLPFASDNRSTAPLVRAGPNKAAGLCALLDTSARESWLSLQAAAAAGVRMLGPSPQPRRAVHVHDEAGGYISVAPHIKLDEIQVENVLFHVRAANGPLGPLARWETDPRPEAVLGGNLLRAFQFVQIDFPGRSAMFSATTPYAPDETRLVATAPLKDLRGAVGCEGSVDGEPADLVLDTGGDFACAMKDPPSAELRQVRIGDLVFRRVPVDNAFERGLDTPEHPRIGRALLSRYKVTLDFRRKLVYFEKPSP